MHRTAVSARVLTLLPRTWSRSGRRRLTNGRDFNALGRRDRHDRAGSTPPKWGANEGNSSIFYAPPIGLRRAAAQQFQAMAIAPPAPFTSQALRGRRLGASI